MDREEAFQVLDLDPTATDDEIEERFRKLAADYHPDTGGDEELMTRILKARDVAQGKTSQDIQVAEQTVAQYSEAVANIEEKRYESQKTVDQLIRRQTSRVRRMRQGTILFGGLFGATVIILRLTDFPLLSTSDPILPMIILMYVIGFGLIFSIFHIQMKNIETLINEADEALDDKMTFINLLQDIGIDYRESPTFSHTDLVYALKEWTSSGSQKVAIFPWYPIFLPPELDFKSLAYQVGSADFSRLLIRKGLEKDILEEDESLEDGEWTICYQINLPER